jgi:hypothetical protein
MESNQTTHASFTLNAPALLSLFGPSSAFPNPDDSNPPGPWGPVIRRAEDRVRLVLEPQPLPWREIFGPVPDPWNEVFGPFPQPWRAAFAQALAQEVVDRATLMQEVADALAHAGSSQAIIIIGGFLSRFIDDCGTGRISQRHIPHPPPRHDGDDRLGARELVLMAAQFERSAAATSHQGLRQEFARAGERLLKMGVGRLQSAAAQSAV